MLKNTWATITARAVDCQLAGQDGEERRADHDRRQHERHRDDGEHATAAAELEAGQHVRRDHPDGQVSTVLTTACQQVNHSTRPSPGADSVSAIVPGLDHLADERDHRPDVEQPEQHHHGAASPARNHHGSRFHRGVLSRADGRCDAPARQDRSRRPSRRRRERRDVSVSAGRSGSTRPATSSGWPRSGRAGSSAGRSGTTAYLVNTSGSATSDRARVDVQVQRQLGLEALSRPGSRPAGGPRPRASVPRRTPANST